MKKCARKGCYNDGCCSDGFCGPHTNSTKQIAPYNSRRMPRSTKPHLGIEIECYAPNETVYKLLRSQSTTPCTDSSLPDFGCEFKMCCEVWLILKRAPVLAEKLSHLGATVNADCGFHVHLDARGVRSDRTAAFCRWLQTWQDFFFGIMPPSRRNNDFCKRLSPNSYLSNHYLWVHPTPYQTIEIRIHSGTLNRHKITGWLSVCADLMDLLRDENRPFPLMIGERSVEDGPLTFPESVLRRVFTRTEAIEYLLSRQNNAGVLTTATLTPHGLRTEQE